MLDMKDKDIDAPLMKVLGKDMQTATFRVVLILAAASVLGATIGALAG